MKIPQEKIKTGLERIAHLDNLKYYMRETAQGQKDYRQALQSWHQANQQQSREDNGLPAK